MNIENKLKQSLFEKSKKVLPPPELKQKVIDNIYSNTGKRKMKKRLTAGLLAAFILIPTSAIAVEGYLADDLYGSFENLKKYVVTTTMDSYMRLNAKLAQAKGELGQEEYEKFSMQLNVLSSARLEYGNAGGYINFDSLPKAKVEEIKLAMMEVQPYFDQLNDLKSSKVILSPNEYEAYIDALMNRETILVKSGLNPSEKVIHANIQTGLLDQYLTVEEIITNAEQKVMDSSIEPLFPSPVFSVEQHKVDVEYGVINSATEKPNLQDINAFTAGTAELAKLKVQTGSKMNVSFENQPDTLEVYIWRNNKLISSAEMTNGNIEFPAHPGKYTFVILGQWEKSVTPYIFTAELKN